MLGLAKKIAAARTGLPRLAAVTPLAVALIAGPGACEAQAADAPPDWAFPVLDPSVKAPADDGVKRSVPGSEAHFTALEMTNLFDAHDWFPGEHPPMPEVVVHGRRPEVRACGMCHLPNGQGRPENAAIAGLPADYIVRQVKEIAVGKRRSSAASTGPQTRMVATAAHIEDAELNEAAGYFAGLTYKPWIRVVESSSAPKASVVFGTMWAQDPAGGEEPLGRRIVELPEDLQRTKLRDPHSGFVAYVPVGSLARGAALATAGDKDRITACVTCHGDQLRGQPPAPPLAGRSATYIVRQLYDMRAGVRQGENAALMKSVVEKMTLDDMIDLAAYAASLRP